MRGPAGPPVLPRRARRSFLRPHNAMAMPPHTTATVRKVLRTVRKLKMIAPGESVLVGVSGGPDSVVLLHILNALAPGLSLRLGVAHLDHGLRPDACKAEARMVADMARALDRPFYGQAVDVNRYARKHGLSVEEAGRACRYDFFNRIAGRHGYQRIAVGHQRDDHAELTLMFLLRGSGLQGISGIPAVRDRRIIRPLIDLKRSEIEAFIADNDLTCVHDASNTDPRHLRNRIRHRLIPLLESEYNPGIVSALNRLATIAGDEDRWAEQMVAPIYAKARIKREGRRLILDLKAIGPQPVAVRRRIIRRAVAEAKGNLRRITFAHVEAVMALSTAGARGSALHLPGRILVTRSKDHLIVSRQQLPLRSVGAGGSAAETTDYTYILAAPGAIAIPEIGACLIVAERSSPCAPAVHSSGPCLALMDRDTVDYPLEVRNLRPGDRYRPLGSAGSRRVRRILMDLHIERSRRQSVPLLLSRGRIVWVAGYRIADAVKITPPTRRVLEIKLDGYPI